MPFRTSKLGPTSTPANQTQSDLAPATASHVSAPNTGGTVNSDDHSTDDSQFFDVEARKICPPFHVEPFTHTPEHFRDIALGPITLHRLFLLAYLVGVILGMHYLQNYIWPSSMLERVGLLWTLLGIVWLIPLPSLIAWVVGALLFRYNTQLDAVPPMQHKVVFRIVSRGTNAECLNGTIRRCQAEMRKTPLFPYLVEVVTDGDAFRAPTDPDVLHTVVPDDYATPNLSRFKARALHYACQYSIVPNTAWVLHLDEESHITSSGVKGIADFVARAERTGNTRVVGQGCILYHRAWKSHPLLTLADMRRTGDDIGHFHLQHRIGRTIFGLHGSYVLVRLDVEQELGLDVGPLGSITEDAWWILLAMEQGIRTAWVDGYIEEQSTQSLTDFLKQRRRWYVGLWKVVWFCPVSWTNRFFLGVTSFFWVIVPVILPLQIAYLVLSIILQKRIVTPIRILTSLAFAAEFAVYLTGLVPNMREHGTPWYRGIMWTFLQMVLFPLFQLLEVAAIVMVFFAPLSQNAKGFHVVQKSGYSDESGVEDLENSSE